MAVRHILLRGFGVVFLVFILGCVNASEREIIESNVASALEEDSIVNDEITEGKVENGDESVAEVGVVNVGSNSILGPGGCTGDECNEYFKNNPEESQKWCDENPVACDKLKGDEGDEREGQESMEGPGGCLDNCEEYCETNPDACSKWCSQNLDKSPELCGFMAVEGEALARQGDGVWEKNELTFYIKDAEGVLTTKRRGIITDTIVSTRQGSGGYYGWNSALEELNRLYPDNIVPDKIIEVNSEAEADIIIAVHSLKEFCCDLTGDPITGKERSSIDDNSGKIKSTVDAYNIKNIEDGFLEDMMRHELGHTMGIFSHVTNRQNDLMSIVSPASVIKKGNLDDLYVKYKDRIIETVQESREADESVYDQKVRSP